MRKFVMLVLATVLLAGACGGGVDDSAQLPANDADDQPAIDAACVADEPECDDTPIGEPQDLPPPGDGDGESPSPISVGEANGAEGRVTVTGFLVVTDGAAHLCEALAESFPPQCGGAAIPMSDYDQVDPDDLQTEGSVTWTDLPVTIRGEVVDGTLRPDSPQ